MLGAQWRAMQREAQLAAAQVAQGVTVLGRANHAQTGLYAQAFFGLSTGLERMGKLIFVADYAIRNKGSFPADRCLRDIGHRLRPLLNRCETVGESLASQREFADRPKQLIHQGIEEVLELYAVKSRYYNLSYLAGAAKDQQDPVGLWWDKVAKPICETHYSMRQRMKDEAPATIMKDLLGDSVSVMHNTETGEPIDNIATLFTQGGATRIVQKYGRLYTMQIIRWLTSIIFDLSHRGAYEERIEALLGLNEPFIIFYNKDEYLKGRKTWSIYRL